MLVLRWLSRCFPSLRFFFAGIGYVMLTMGGLVWFVCFPLTVYTLYVANEFPLNYFGVDALHDSAVDYYLPENMRRPLGGVCVGFTLYGLFLIYFNVKSLRRLRRGEK